MAKERVAEMSKIGDEGGMVVARTSFDECAGHTVRLRLELLRIALHITLVSCSSGPFLQHS